MPLPYFVAREVINPGWHHLTVICDLLLINLRNQTLLLNGRSWWHVEWGQEVCIEVAEEVVIKRNV
jgi:hypothetical protein